MRILRGFPALLIMALIPIAACDSESHVSHEDDPFQSGRRVPRLEWRPPVQVSVDLGTSGFTVLAIAATSTGALVAIGAPGNDSESDPRPHRLLLLRYESGTWSMAAERTSVVPFFVASVGWDPNGDDVLFWIGDPQDPNSPDDRNSGSVGISQEGTTLYACRLANGCIISDSLHFGRRIRARLENVVAHDGELHLTIDELPFVGHHVTLGQNGLRESAHFLAFLSSLSASHEGLLLFGIGSKVESSSGFRLFSQRWDGSTWDGPLTVFENENESVMRSSVAVDSGGQVSWCLVLERRWRRGKGILRVVL